MGEGDVGLMDLHAHLHAAPAPLAERYVHFEKVGQLFGWMTKPNQNFLVNWLPDIARAYPHHPMRIVEVGTFGGSTARGLVTMTGGGHAVCIDDFRDFNEGTLSGRPDGTAYWNETITKNGTDLSAHATLLFGKSEEIGASWKNPIDLLLVDGDHAFEPALSDLRLYGPHVVSGGYLLIDDTQMPEVERAVRHFLTAEAAVATGSAWSVIRQREPGVADDSLLILRRS